MSTVDRVHKMFYKAAAANRFNAKIMQKRAAFANYPSDAYLAGFCKAAEDIGVNPVELMKIAGFGDWLQKGWNGIKSIGSSMANAMNPMNTVNGIKNMFGGGTASPAAAPTGGMFGGLMNKFKGWFGRGGSPAPAAAPAAAAPVAPPPAAAAPVAPPPAAPKPMA